MSLKLEGIHYIYGQGTEMVVHALNDINIEIKEGEFIGLIGHTGSGKSTLVQHLNGLIKPTEGHIYLDEQDIYAEGYSMKELAADSGIGYANLRRLMSAVDTQDWKREQRRSVCRVLHISEEQYKAMAHL